MVYRGGHLTTVVTVVLGFIVASASLSAAETAMAAPVSQPTSNYPTTSQSVTKGEYIARAAGCIICHTDPKHKDRPFAGGRALHTPFGTFNSPNITPDKATGIGNWTEQDFLNAMHEGINPSGDNLYPVFPYTSYTRLSDEDTRALWAYLRTVKPVHQLNKTHQLKWFAPPRFAVSFWKWLYFTPGRYKEDPNKPASWNRGAYLSTAAAHCGECHTPRNLLGGKISDLRYAGAENKEEDFVAPNITPASKTGIGDWTITDLVTYFQLGLDPDGDSAGSIMADFIDDDLSHLSKTDLQAIAEYITSLPPIEHSLKKKKKSQPAAEKPYWD